MKEYALMNRRINLKKDLKWHEVRHLQNFLREADIWNDFPVIGLTLVSAEIKKSWNDQSIDLLYLRQDGALIPCELKIGGNSKDSHGQLIRYIADLHYRNPFDLLKDSRNKFVEGLDDPDPIVQRIHKKKFNDFMSVNGIDDKFIRILPRSGILMDEEFQPYLLKAVRYLNEVCGFSIKMIQIKAYVKESWSQDDTSYLFRVDFVDIQ
ncbi:MAG: hypothetical protein Q7J76_07400 [Candidatus Brocadiaceae bacterium]|nr:hypothetical protein [Candidatus Brocadiaceae bacterium]